MDKIKIDLLRQKYQLEAPRRKPFLFFGRVTMIVLIVCATTGAALSYQITSSNDASGFPSLSLFSTIRHLVNSDNRQLRGEENDRVNFLLMGIGGEGHEGPQLTDTILLASYKPSTGEVGMLSIPRDMAVPIPGYGWRKVNHANAFGEMQETGTGPLLATEVVGGVLEQDIPYYVRVDFEGFATLIDDVGGVDIYVDKTFTDYEYPILGDEYTDCGTTTEVLDEDGNTIEVPTYTCRFETVTFHEGWMHLDGETALKYVRSRHGTNGEGSDFARSRRQQKVILAVKDKIFSVETAVNPARISSILGTLNDNIASNLTMWELLRLADAFKSFDQNNLKSYVLDASETSPLYATSLNGAYVLLPRNDDWDAVQDIAKNIFGIPSATLASDESKKPTFVKVEIQNGTTVNGLAFRASQLLDQQGFDVLKIGNAQERGYDHTVIYDLTNGQRQDELQSLQDYLQADVMQSATGWLMSDEVIPKELTLNADDAPSTEDDVDFLIILGENSANLVLN
jgi:LCP family protein required for cell wall assembly